jgi:ATP-dependent DNA ligase
VLGHALAPMLAQLESRLPVGAQWRYEPKLDGFRGLLRRRATGQTRLLSRNGCDLGPWFPELLQAAQMLALGTLLDGEIVICDESGWAEFGRLQERLSTANKRIDEIVAEHPAVLVVFDALELAGEDIYFANARVPETRTRDSPHASQSPMPPAGRPYIGCASCRGLARFTER